MKQKLGLILCLLIHLSINAQEFGTLMKAQTAFSNQNWKDSKDSFTKVIQSNPYNGEYYYKLGWSQYHLKEYNDASESFKTAFNIGYLKPLSSYNAACSFSLNGNIQKSMEWLKRSLESGLQDHEQTVRKDADLQAIKDLEEYRSLFPKNNVNLDRQSGWETDILYYKKKFELMHFDLFSQINKKEWEAQINKLIKNIDKYSDSKIIVELMNLTSSLGAGHSYIVPPFSGEFQFHQIPIELYEFSDGIYVRKVKKGYEMLLGKKVIKVEQTPIEEAIRQVGKVSNPENEINSRWTSLFYMTLPEVLHGLGISQSMDKMSFTVLGEFGLEVIELEPELFSPQIIMSKGTPQGWVSLSNVKQEPNYLARPNESFWHEYDEDAGIVYAKLNQIRNGSNQSLADFGKEIVMLAEDKKAVLVLDLRLNNGGNGMLAKDFLLELIKSKEINTPGRLFTIIGRKTYSAAILLATKLDEYTETIFLGEPTGGKPSHIGDDNNFTLPYSGLIASAAMTYWQSPVSYDNREWIAPEVYIPISLNNYINGEDPVMEYIRDLIQKMN